MADKGNVLVGKGRTECKEFVCKNALEMANSRCKNGLRTGCDCGNGLRPCVTVSCAVKLTNCVIKKGNSSVGRSKVSVVDGIVAFTDFQLNSVNLSDIRNNTTTNRRRSLRFDSLESSDSGVATLSSVDSSHSSGTSDITEPASPTSSASSPSCPSLPSSDHLHISGYDATSSPPSCQGSYDSGVEEATVVSSSSSSPQMPVTSPENEPDKDDEAPSSSSTSRRNADEEVACDYVEEEEDDDEEEDEEDEPEEPSLYVDTSSGVGSSESGGISGGGNGDDNNYNNLTSCDNTATSSNLCAGGGRSSNSKLCCDWLSSSSTSKEPSSGVGDSSNKAPCYNLPIENGLYASRSHFHRLWKSPVPPPPPPSSSSSSSSTVDNHFLKYDAASHLCRLKRSGGHDDDDDSRFRCHWTNCGQVVPSGGDIVEHIRGCHVDAQVNAESFVCLWEGCKVYNKASCSLSWLERHVLTHSGNKPFKCIVDGCGQRFTSQTVLERHVNSHFNQPQSQSSNVAKRKEDTPTKLMKKKKFRYRRTAWTTRKEDFFDTGVMECLKHQMMVLNDRTHLDLEGNGSFVTFNSTVIARQVESSGKVRVLLHWIPENIVPDEWVYEAQVIAKLKQTIPLSRLPRESLQPLCSSDTSAASSPYRKNRRK